MQNYMAIQFKIMAKVGRTVVFFEIIGAKSMTVSFAESSGEAISKYRVIGRFLTPYTVLFISESPRPYLCSKLALFNTS